MGGVCNIHTGSRSAAQLLTSMEQATGQQLRSSTLDSVARAFSMNRSTGSGKFRYCPACVCEHADDALPYGRLLWEMQFVTACPKHHLELRSVKCGAPEECLPLQHRPVMDGVCPSCGSIGYRCRKDELIRASPEDVGVARQAELLIALQAREPVVFSAQTLHQGIIELVHTRFQGSVVRASLDCGLSRGTVCTWVKGARVALPYFIQLCLRSQADIEALCRGQYRQSSHAPMVATNVRISTSYRRSNLSTPTLKQAILNACKRAEPPSLHALARELGVHIDTPRHRAPEEAKLLSAAHTRHRRELAQRQQELYEKQFELAAKALVAEGRTVHKRALQVRSGVPAFSKGRRSAALDGVLKAYSAGGRAAPEMAPKPPSRIAQTLAEVRLEIRAARAVGNRRAAEKRKSC